jgi:hypothetical protein
VVLYSSLFFPFQCLIIITITDNNNNPQLTHPNFTVFLFILSFLQLDCSLSPSFLLPARSLHYVIDLTQIQFTQIISSFSPQPSLCSYSVTNRNFCTFCFCIFPSKINFKTPLLMFYFLFKVILKEKEKQMKGKTEQ